MRFPNSTDTWQNQGVTVELVAKLQLQPFESKGSWIGLFRMWAQIYHSFGYLMSLASRLFVLFCFYQRMVIKVDWVCTSVVRVLLCTKLYLIMTSTKIATEADLKILCNITNLECVLKVRLRVVKGQLINRSRDCQFLTAFLLPITVFWDQGTHWPLDPRHC